MTRSEWITGALVTLAMLVIYGASSAPGLGLVDSGELTTAAWSLGVAHPTGYPLYVLLGRTLLLISPLSVARTMVLASVLYGAFACGLFALLVVRVMRSVVVPDGVAWGACAAALACAFGLSNTAWSSVAFAEVYPLTWLLAILIVVLSWRIALDQEAVSPAFGLAACYVWGLAFGNHFTILWLAPLVGLTTFRLISRAVHRVRMAAWCVLLFLLGASVNFYLPVRSSVEPLLNWSNPQTLAGLLRHLTAWQYRVWMFTGDFGTFFAKLGAYLKTVPQDIGWGILLAVVIGAVTSLRRQTAAAVCLIGAWLLGMGYNLNYDIADIQTYFLSLYVPLLPLAMWGMIRVVRWTQRLGPQIRAVAAVTASVVPLGLAAATVQPDVWQSTNRFASDYARAAVGTLPDSSLVLQGDWDIQSPFIYLKNVEGWRRDVVMLDMNLMQRPWYIRQERRAHPDVFNGSETEIEEFMRLVAPFEAGRPFDAQQLEHAFVSMLDSILRNNLSRRPTYVRDMREIGHPSVAALLRKYPGGYFLRVSDTPGPEAVLRVAQVIGGRHPFSPREQFLLGLAARALIAQGHFAMSSGDVGTVQRTLEESRLLAPLVPEAADYLRDARRSLSGPNTATVP